jgi:class 3 adenylate cyclase
MQCPQCVHKNPAGSSFCLECGARLDLKCGSCGTDLPAGSKFCNKCGTAVSSPTASQPRFASPESYTPKHLAEKILTSKSALEDERKQVTILFADLKGSMELLADRDPEEARKLLDPVLERMMEAVHRYEGTVNQVMGDGIMALFGAPLAHEDHAVRACYAALWMQEIVKKYAEEVRRSHAAVVKIRIGLNSGEVVVRAIGSDLHMDYTAVGQTTHLAARMEQLADPGAIVITPETLALAEGYVEVKSLGPVPVKRRSGPLEIFELMGAGQARTRLQAAALRGLTRFVGRDAEVEHLRRVLGQAGAGRGQMVAIVGEAGVGKSRLTYEFTHSHRVQDWLILEASSVSYGKATSYLPVIDLLKGYFKIGDWDNHREMRDKVMGRGCWVSTGRSSPSCPHSSRCSTYRSKRFVAGARSRSAPPAHAQGSQAPAAPRESEPTAPRRLRGLALDRRRDASPPRQPGREPASGAAPLARQLPAGAPARLGEEDLLQSTSARRAAS